MAVACVEATTKTTTLTANKQEIYSAFIWCARCGWFESEAELRAASGGGWQDFPCARSIVMFFFSSFFLSHTHTLAVVIMWPQFVCILKAGDDQQFHSWWYDCSTTRLVCECFRTVDHRRQMRNRLGHRRWDVYTAFCQMQRWFVPPASCLRNGINSLMSV